MAAVSNWRRILEDYMNYQVGQPGRVIVARFNDGDNVLDL